MKRVRRVVQIACLMLASLPVSVRAVTPTWLSTTDAAPWQTMPAPVLAAAQANAPPTVRIYPGKTFQTIDGFGGCFNEIGWRALSTLPAAERERAMQLLFADDGCAFNQCRLPIGASDFGLDWYSLDDTPGDLALEHFSIARDEQCLIPYVKAAMAIRPDLKCFGSAWSPPAWMKTSNVYHGGSLKWEPAVLSSYATYLARWVEEYRKAGVNVFAVMTQNEPNVEPIYPGCAWTGSQLREFVADYLGPTLAARKTDVELWLGTLADANVNDRTAAVLDDPKANAFVTGVGYQYGGAVQIIAASELYPNKKFLETEADCNSGDNSWANAEHLYTLIRHYIEHGAVGYTYWNMVLDKTGKSSWNWRQNCLITADRTSGKVTLHDEYYVMRHFAQFVRPGAKRVLTVGPWGDKIAFVNPDGSTVLVMGNSDDKANLVRLDIAGQTVIYAEHTRRHVAGPLDQHDRLSSDEVRALAPSPSGRGLG